MEKTLGDIANDALYQGIKALVLGGFPPGLWHRMRLDSEFRQKLIAASRSFDREPPGRMYPILFDDDFSHPARIVSRLDERSPYAGRPMYRLRDEILIKLMMPDYESRIIPVYPIKLYHLELYRDMCEGLVIKEFARRGLVSASPTEALCYAILYTPPREGSGVVQCLSAQQKANGEPRLILGFGWSGLKNPIIAFHEKPKTFPKGTIFLVKQKSA